MELIHCTKHPCREALHQDGDTWMVMDDNTHTDLTSVKLEGTAARDATPKRTDLDPSHPLYRKRALRNVPAGSGDIVVTDTGVITTDLTAVEAIAMEIP